VLKHRSCNKQIPQQSIGSFHGAQHESGVLLDLFPILAWIVVVVTRRASSIPFSQRLASSKIVIIG